ncbi:MAG: nucleoside hydrolase [Chloroflexi bacterium]|nr:nucleoside hydrolase [Chloroflexota bacterium]
MRRFWIDTDTASDDAVAILMALRTPDVLVEGISVTAGNVPVEMGARNARYTVELCGKDTPVYLGAGKPLLREPNYAYFFHGPDGMGGTNLPEPKLPLQKAHAIPAFIDAVRKYPGEITLVTLGPLTNMALAFAQAPDITSKIKMCYVMGGVANTTGNITPAAEFNIWFDPDAARMFFHSGLPFMMVGWEHCRWDANFDEAEIQAMRAFNTPYADFSIDINATATAINREMYGEPGMTLPDPITMAIAIDPAVAIRSAKYFVDIETQSELTRGATVVDELNVTHQAPNAEVCWEIDIPRWKETLYKTLRPA